MKLKSASSCAGMARGEPDAHGLHVPGRAGLDGQVKDQDLALRPELANLPAEAILAAAGKELRMAGEA